MKGRIVVIGNFDGVHLGHRAVLAEAAREAATLALEPTVLTFAPHPAVVLGRPEPPRLTNLDRKRELVGRVSPSLTLTVEPFDTAFAAQTPELFAERVLARELGARVVVVGDNFRFGKGRAGDFARLRELGGALGFATHSHDLVGDEHGPWSSTRIRDAIRRGDLDDATRMLGRPHMLSGVVVRGDERGRTIGFPTANLAGVAEALPPFGVYAVLVDRVGPDGTVAIARGVANLGVRPTVKEKGAAPTLEVHLFDWTGDLYDASLRVHCIARLREEKTFAGLPALKEQIARDADAARAVLVPLVPDPAAGGGWR